MIQNGRQLALVIGENLHDKAETEPDEQQHDADALRDAVADWFEAVQHRLPLPPAILGDGEVEDLKVIIRVAIDVFNQAGADAAELDLDLGWRTTGWAREHRQAASEHQRAAERHLAAAELIEETAGAWTLDDVAYVTGKGVTP